MAINDGRAAAGRRDGVAAGDEFDASYACGHARGESEMLALAFAQLDAVASASEPG